MIKLFSAAMIVALTAGCAYIVGDAAIIDETPASIAQSVVIGKTTKADVEAKYGLPSTVSFDSNGMEIWLYGSTAIDMMVSPNPLLGYVIVEMIAPAAADVTLEDPALDEYRCMSCNTSVSIAAALLS